MNLFKFSVHTFLILALCATFIPCSFAFQKPGETDTVKIGLLIPDKNSLAALNGAELAIRNANKNGGFNGKPFSLDVRSMEGPWGNGSKQAVNLIFDEEVWAIIGSHDGRNAHLVEQVAAKARIVFLSAWATDPTLSQAFVPWFFNCVPNDLQQSAILIDEIYNKRKFSKVAALSDNSYDSKMAIKSFAKMTRSSGKEDPLQFFYQGENPDFSTLLNKINNADPDCIILFGESSGSLRLISQMRSKKMNNNVFGASSLLNENKIPINELEKFEGLVFVSSNLWSDPKVLAFVNEFSNLYGKKPGPVAAYAYDGVWLIIDAIRKAGLDRNKIQKALVEINFEGITGKIHFDGKGNRNGTTGLMEIKNSLPVAAGR